MSQRESEILVEQGIECRNKGDYASAVKRFAQSIHENPHLLSAYLEAGKTEREVGNFAEALQWFDKAEQVSKTNFWPYYLRAEAMLHKEDFAAALRYVSQGLSACKGCVSETEYTNLFKCFIDLTTRTNPVSNAALSRLLADGRPPGRALENALRVSLVKDEEDIIGHSLEASYQVGIRYYVIADNKSLDGTKREIQKFSTRHPDCVVLVVDDTIDGYFQSYKTMGLARLGVTVLKAQGKNIEWIFPLDADECIHIGSEFEDLHSVVGSEFSENKKMLVYYLCNATTKDLLVKVDEFVDLNRTFVKFSSYSSQFVRKVAFRYSENSFLDYGNHYCNHCLDDPTQILFGFDFGIALKHYPIRSLCQLKSKIVNGGKSIAALGPGSIGAHWRQDYQNFLSEGDGYILRKFSEYHAATQDFSIES